MMQNLARIAVLLACFFAATLVVADPITDIYQIDVVIFEHTDPKRFTSEHWPKFVGNLNTIKAVKLNSLKNNVPDSIETMDVLDALDEAGEQPVNKVVQESITLVDPPRMVLNKEVSKIRAGKTERFIKYIAWNQPLAIGVKSTPVYFTGGNDQEVAALMSLKPVRQNLFNVSVDLIYKLQPGEQNLAPGVNEIRVTRDVKVKRKEVYYIDHPVIGILVSITPVVMDDTGR